ncbi:HicB family protein [Geomonas silvestris]|uniref:HicB family protein n=1 Tax=Geomonas silvestris TaxID=2740184 RepID=A0A6V8MMI9_9BACT|nr:type II toxin-antitoxin system HicB family antitoxin [Geomonas silvestris]GFO61251.1 HicB family protein [Geomonas silvestris]
MYSYLVVIEKTETNFSAYAPDLPGCVATGATREETEANMRKALKFHIEGLMEDNQPIPEPRSYAEIMAVS